MKVEEKIPLEANIVVEIVASNIFRGKMECAFPFFLENEIKRPLTSPDWSRFCKIQWERKERKTFILLLLLFPPFPDPKKSDAAAQ